MMNAPCEKSVKAGDWIRWQDDDNLVIGVVQYVIKREGRTTEIVTDIGTCWLSSVLERRAPN